MNIGVVGCGFVADYYISTLAAYPQLVIIGATDRDPDRAARFSAFHKLPKFDERRPTTRPWLRVAAAMSRLSFMSTT